MNRTIADLWGEYRYYTSQASLLARILGYSTAAVVITGHGGGAITLILAAAYLLVDIGQYVFMAFGTMRTASAVETKASKAIITKTNLSVLRIGKTLFAVKLVLVSLSVLSLII